MKTDAGWASMIPVGRIVRPHGIRGQVVVAPETDVGDERFATGVSLWGKTSRGAPEILTVISGRPHRERWVIAFDGLETMEAAERWRGAELRIAADALKSLGPREYYLHDLVGCAVVTTEGVAVGAVRAVYPGAAHALLGIDSPRGEVLVPLVPAICPDVDVVARRITIAPPEGLLEVNAVEPRS